MMTCGGSSFHTGNNYNNGSYLGPPPFELHVEGDEVGKTRIGKDASLNTEEIIEW